MLREGRARVRLKQNRKGQERHANAFELQQFSFQNATLLTRAFCFLWGLRGKRHGELARSAFHPACDLELLQAARQGSK